MSDTISTSDNDIQDNLNNWNDRASVHMDGGYGNISAFVANASAITPVVRRDNSIAQPFLGSQGLANRRLLHLQCHIGLDTISWYRLGARDVHGLDFSDVSLKYARSLAHQAHAPVTFVQGDARYADQALANKIHQFDVIVTSIGTITWLPELQAWARSIANLLAPGGIFIIRDVHPMLFALDNSGMEVVQSYFSGTESSYDSDSSYTPGSTGKIVHTRNHNWAHDFHEITDALLNAGLIIRSLGEHRIAEWKSLPMLVADKETGGWRMPEHYPDIPLTFSIVATGPQY